MGNKYTFKEFQRQYRNDDICLDEIFKNRYSNMNVCPSCKKETTFYKVSRRKCYACQFCGYQLHPLADTIFHKSETPLTSWFFAIYLFSVSKNGVSAKELQRQLGVTYKTAWRMGQQIRKLFTPGNEELMDIVEADETYIGPKGRENKSTVVGMVQRKGEVRAEVVSTKLSKSVTPVLRKHVAIGATLMTDFHGAYSKAQDLGLKRQKVNHSKAYVDGIKHINTIEGFWSQLKRGLDGTYHFVSSKHLQSYVNEFAWRYNHRILSSSLFSLILSKAVKPV